MEKSKVEQNQSKAEQSKVDQNQSKAEQNQSRAEQNRPKAEPEQSRREPEQNTEAEQSRSEAQESQSRIRAEQNQSRAEQNQKRTNTTRVEQSRTEPKQNQNRAERNRTRREPKQNFRALWLELCCFSHFMHYHLNSPKEEAKTPRGVDVLNLLQHTAGCTLLMLAKIIYKVSQRNPSKQGRGFASCQNCNQISRYLRENLAIQLQVPEVVNALLCCRGGKLIKAQDFTQSPGS